MKNEDVITKFEGHRFQIIKIHRKKFSKSDITPPYIPALMNLAIFGDFSQYIVKG